MKRFHEFDEWDEVYKKTWSYFFYKNINLDFIDFKICKIFVGEVSAKIFLTVFGYLFILVWYYIGVLFKS